MDCNRSQIPKCWRMIQSINLLISMQIADALAPLQTRKDARDDSDALRAKCVRRRNMAETEGFEPSIRLYSV
jgi:hypothetical protein